MSKAGASYELLELIGSGGMGHVYRARHHPTGHEVAVKVPHETLRDSLGHLLLQEAAAVARLQHPNIVELVDLVEEGPTLVMELVDGVSLRRHLSPWPGWSSLASVVTQVLEGLTAAHADGIVHGDLKPANVLVRSDGVAKIADFGLARLVDPLRRARGEPLRAGTPAYMAPEQLARDGEIGPWTDLYAVGVLLYEVLYGQLPHGGSVSTLVNQKRSPELPPRPLRPGLSVDPALDRLVHRLLHAQPRLRPRFAAEVRAELQSLKDAVTDDVAALEVASTPPAQSTAYAATVASSESLAIDDTEELEAPIVSLPHRIRSEAMVGRALLHLRGHPLVARRAERKRLSDLMIDVVVRRRPRLVVVTGPAGIGKSALARWGLREVERTATMEGLAAGYELSGGGLTGGLQHVLRRVLGPPAEQREGATEAWSWMRDDETELAPAFDHEAALAWLKADRGVASADDLFLVHNVLRAAARKRPLYLWLDDAGWSRDGAFDLVESLLEERHLPMLMVLTLRSGTAGHPWVATRLSELTQLPGADHLELAPLSPHARLELVEQVVPLAAELSEALSGLLDGTPRQLIERATSWIEQGLLRPSPTGWEAAAGITVDPLLSPEVAHHLVTARLTNVFGEVGASFAREVLLRAALLGWFFEEKLLLASFRTDERESAKQVLGRALLEGVLTFDRDAEVYRFESAEAHGHVLDSLGNLAQASAEVLAKALESRFEEGRVGMGARTAYLYRRSGDLETSYAVLREAVRQMGRWGYPDRAQELAAVGAAWLEADGDAAGPHAVLDVVMADASQHYYALRYPDALARLRDAAPLLQERPDPIRASLVSGLELLIHYYSNRLGTAVRICQDARPQWNHNLDQRLVHTAFIHIHVETELLGLAGRHDEAVELARYGERRFADSPIPGHPESSWVTLSEQLVAAGRLEEAQREVERMRNHPPVDNTVREELLDTFVRVAMFSGRWEDVKPRLQARLDAAIRHQDGWRETAHRVYLAWYAVEREDDTKAAGAVEAMLRAYAAAPQEEAMTTLALGYVARGLTRRGQTDLASRVQALVDARHEAIRIGFTQ